MRKIWQTEWHGIRFEEFSSLSETEIADSDFYNKFYTEFYERHHCYEDIKKSWIEEKNQIAQDLLKQFEDDRNILSIGCGIGYIEKIIYESSKNINLVAIEPNLKAVKWLPDGIDFRQGYFPEAVEGESFDSVYISGVDYCFSDEEYLVFLGKVKKSGIHRFILAGHHEPCEQLAYQPVDHVKALAKHLLAAIGLYKPKNGQFWGYLRSLAEQSDFLVRAGFSKLTVGKHGAPDRYYIIAE